MKKLVILLLTLAVIPATQSCKKKKKNSGPSAEEILTDGDWNYTKEEYYDAAGNLTNTYQINHIVKFKSDGTYERYDANQQLLTSGTWELKDNDSKIRIVHSNGSFDTTFDIVKLEDSEFIYEWINPQVGNKIKFYHER